VNPLAIPALAGAAYYSLAVVAALRFRRAPAPRLAAPLLPVSILKPVHGRDPRFYEALVSHARQQYPAFEILFGVSDPRDAALEDIARLRREFPSVPMSLHVVPTTAPNMKAGVLEGLAAQARHPWIVVNDSDISVGPDYLREVAAPLADPAVGLVTCLYRARADHWAARAEALGIATEFAPSVLVARLLGQAEFALGSTMAFRAETLAAAGGFGAIASYLADDYQLGRRISELGRRVEFSRQVVETGLAGRSAADVWRHQLRWSRTVRVSRPAGYYGYVVTHATFWALVAMAAGEWQAGCAALAVRLAAGVLVGAGILGYRRAWSDFWAMPLRDLFGFAVWVAGLFGSRVEWRGERLRLQPDGTIRRCQ
jgi:ceramide glucosyltransferase